MTSTLTRRQVLDLDFLEARGKLIEIAAFLDRVDRATGEADFRLHAFRQALTLLAKDTEPQRAERVLREFSDPTTDPIPQAPGKGACGAWPSRDIRTGPASSSTGATAASSR